MSKKNTRRITRFEHWKQEVNIKIIDLLSFDPDSVPEVCMLFKKKQGHIFQNENGTMVGIFCRYFVISVY